MLLPKIWRVGNHLHYLLYLPAGVQPPSGLQQSVVVHFIQPAYQFWNCRQPVSELNIFPSIDNLSFTQNLPQAIPCILICDLFISTVFKAM